MQYKVSLSGIHSTGMTPCLVAAAADMIRNTLQYEHAIAHDSPAPASSLLSHLATM